MSPMTTAPELTSVLPIDLYNRLQGLPVALYARLSRNPDGTLESTDVQLAILRRMATERWPGRTQVEFVDDDLTAADDEVYRPGFEKMLTAIEDGQIGDVCAREQERVSRHETIWPRFKKVCTKAGITHLRTVNEGDIPMMDGESLGPDIVNLVNAHYVTSMKAKQRGTLDERVRQGRPHGGQPYGYRLDRGEDNRARLVVVPEQAAVVDQMVDKLIKGWSLADVARWLNESGIPTKRGGKVWDETVVKSVVTNPTAAAYVVQGKGRTKVKIESGPRKGKYRYKYTHREIVGDAEWPAIIDRDRWNQVRDILSRPRRVRRSDGEMRIIAGTKRPARSYLLSGGTMTCGLCETAMVAGTYHSRRDEVIPYYLCRKSVGGCGHMAIKAGESEAYVIDLFMDYLDSKAFVRFLRKIDTDRPKREKLQSKIKAEETKRKAAGAAMGSGRISLDALEAAEVEIDKEIGALRARLGDLAPVPFETDPQAIRVGFEHLNLAEQRQMLADYGCSVVVSSATPGTSTFDSSRLSVRFGGQ